MTSAEDKDDLPPETWPAAEAAAPANAPGLEDELARLKDQLLRTLADSENTRKRAQRDREDAGKYAIANFARDMLDFADNFHRALAAVPAELRAADARIAGVIAGIETMEKELLRAFEKHGITKIEPMGVPFNANFHEVMFEAPGTGQPAGMIIQLIEPGYMLKDRLLRPARVGVAKGDAPATGGTIDTQA